MAHETSSWHAELDLRVFAHLHAAPSGRADVTPSEALGIRAELKSVQEVVDRIHYMLKKGWIDGGAVNAAGVIDAALAPCLRHGMAEWIGDRCRGDVICRVLADQDSGRPVEPERFVGLRDAAISFC